MGVLTTKFTEEQEKEIITAILKRGEQKSEGEEIYPSFRENVYVIRIQKTKSGGIGIFQIPAYQEIPADVIKARLIAEEVFKGFCELIEQNYSIVQKFYTVFNERATDPYLPESQGQDGLYLTLEGIIGRYPKKTFNTVFEDNTQTQGIPTDIAKEQFFSALQNIALHNPYVFQLLQKIREKNGWAIYDTIRALLVEYIKNKDAVPY
jgi:hypothetical protein